MASMTAVSMVSLAYMVSEVSHGFYGIYVFAASLVSVALMVSMVGHASVLCF